MTHMTNPQIEAPAHYIPITAISYADTDGTAIATSVANPLPVNGTVTLAGTTPVVATSPMMAARAWPLGTTLDAMGFGVVRVQVDAIDGGDAVGFVCALAAGGAAYPWQVRDQAGNAYLGITAPGIYTLAGYGFITATQAGSASTPLLTVSASV